LDPDLEVGLVKAPALVSEKAAAAESAAECFGLVEASWLLALSRHPTLNTPKKLARPSMRGLASWA
jgi:hypothetical protein